MVVLHVIQPGRKETAMARFRHTRRGIPYKARQRRCGEVVFCLKPCSEKPVFALFLDGQDDKFLKVSES
jgi:hypothetical protein